METVSIRKLRGASLLENARNGKLLAITNYRELIAVIVPVQTAWVEHLIDYNWSRVHQSITEGEQAMTKSGQVRLDDVTEVQERLAGALVATLAGGSLTHAPTSSEAFQQIRNALSAPDLSTASVDGPAEPPSRTVRIGDLSASVIEQAGAAGQVLALTHERQLVGMVIPVTKGLVHFLIEQTMSRVQTNIRLAEKQLNAFDEVPTLDRVVGQPAAGQTQGAPRQRVSDESGPRER